VRQIPRSPSSCILIERWDFLTAYRFTFNSKISGPEELNKIVSPSLCAMERICYQIVFGVDCERWVSNEVSIAILNVWLFLYESEKFVHDQNDLNLRSERRSGSVSSRDRQRSRTKRKRSSGDWTMSLQACQDSEI
jgi:hypothetical protein